MPPFSQSMESHRTHGRWGWGGEAWELRGGGAAAGVPFFVGCVAWNWSPAMAGSLGLALLKFLVMSGAMLQARPRASWRPPLLAAGA